MAPKFDKLDDDNYAAWSIHVEALRENVWDVVSGEEKPPTDKTALPAFTQKQRKARNIIVLYTSQKYIGVCCEEEDPKKIWDKFATLFRARGCGAIAARRRNFNTMEFNLDKSMKEWIAEGETAARELEHIGLPMETLDIYNTLIRNLPIEYRPLIVYLDGLPTDDTDPNCITIPLITKRLIDEEARHTTMFGGNFDMLGNEVKSYYASSRTPRVKRCFNCGEEGHFKGDCDILPREARLRREQQEPQVS